MPLIPCICKENEAMCRAEEISGGKPAVELNSKALSCSSHNGGVNLIHNTRYVSRVNKKHSNHARNDCIF